MTADMNLKPTDVCSDKNVHDMLICLQVGLRGRGFFQVFQKEIWIVDSIDNLDGCDSNLSRKPLQLLLRAYQ